MVVVLVALGVATTGTLVSQRKGTTPLEAPAIARSLAPVTHPAEDANVVSRGWTVRLRPLRAVQNFLGPVAFADTRTDGLAAPTQLFQNAASEAANVQPLSPYDACSRGPSAEPVTPLAALVSGEVWSAPEQLAVRTVVQTLNENDIRSQVVVATVPDWVNSNLQWLFDAQLDALQMSAAAMGFLLLSYDLPDWSRTPSRDAAEQALWSASAHELSPGSVLFRRVSLGPDRTPQVELLLVLLVPETATEGVRSTAMANAIDLALLWNTNSHMPTRGNAQGGEGTHVPVPILGPTYSGSVLSVRAALTAAVTRNRLCNLGGGALFDVVTPSASNPANQDYLTIPGVSRFRSVIRSDQESLRALQDTLGRIKADWRCGRGIALLEEANTAWGQGLTPAPLNVSTAKGSRPSQAQPDSCGACLSGDPLAPPFSCARVVPFPLHISRLRSVSSAPETQSSAPGAAAVHLELQDTVIATDQIPTITPTLTAALVESSLTTMFRSLEDSGVTAIGILATDKRDHVYLAEQIAAHRPNALTFTVESSLVYLHPDVRSYMRGTLIASTYSLSPLTQLLARSPDPRRPTHQFASSYAHGLYNALALLLEAPGVLIDYDIPGGVGTVNEAVPPCQGIGPCAPPVWISVAANDGLHPIRAVVPTPCRADAPSYVTCVPGSTALRAGSQQVGSMLFGFPWVVSAVVLALIAVAIRLRAARRSSGTELRLYASNPTAVDVEIGVAVVAIHAALVTCALWSVKMLMLWCADFAAIGGAFSTFRLIYQLLTSVAVVYVLSLLLSWLWPRTSTRMWLAARTLVVALTALIASEVWDLPGVMRHSVQIGAVALVMASIAVVVAGAPPLKGIQLRRIPALFGVAAFTCLAAYLALDYWDGLEALLYYDRNAALQSLISPSVFILCASASLAWWGAWSLRRIDLVRLPEIEVGIGRFLQVHARRAGVDDRQLLGQPALTLRFANAIPLVALLALVASVPLGGVGTFEGVRFNGFLWMASACVVTVMANTLATSLTLGQSVLELLRAVAQHPAVSTIAKVGKEAYLWNLTFSQPRRAELQQLLRSIHLIHDNWPALSQELSASLHRDEAHRVYKDLSLMARRVDTSASRKDWQALDRLVNSFHEILDKTRWRPSYVDSALSAEVRGALQSMETMVFFHAAIVLRDLLTRLVSGFATVAGGMLLLFLGHLLYVFQGRIYWLNLDSLAIASLAACAIFTLVSLERDPVVSQLWGTEPGKVNALGRLSVRAALYTLLALISLLAAFFPEFAGSFVQWIEPAKKLFPL